MGEDDAGRGGTADDRASAADAARGDGDARRRVLERVLPTLRGAVTMVLGPGPDAEDATQQAAIDVLRGLHTYRGDASLTAWARTIGVRAALRLARSRRPVAMVEPDELQGSSGGDVPRMADSIPGELRAHLEALPALQREAIVLRHGMGYTTPELSELLGTSVNTIKSRLLEGRKALRARIRQQALVAGARGRRKGGGS